MYKQSHQQKCFFPCKHIFVKCGLENATAPPRAYGGHNCSNLGEAEKWDSC